MSQPIRHVFFGTLILICGFSLGQIWDQPYRIVLKYFHQDEYGKHVFNCDNAMREHFIAKSRISKKADKIDIEALRSTELGLIDCHYYDKFRKKLLSLGLYESDLSAMGLKAIEEKKADLSVLVKQHEIRY